MRVEGARAAGRQLDGGRELACDIVVANVDPRLLYTRLVDAADLPAEFLRRISRYKCGSGTFRMNVALSELPRLHLPARHR